MKGQEQQHAFVMRRSRWSAFSVIGYVLFGLLLPAILLTHVFADYVTYVSGYAKHAKQATEQSVAAYEADISDLNEEISKTEAEIATLTEDISALSTEISTLKSAKEAEESEKATLEQSESALLQEIVDLTNAISALDAQRITLMGEQAVLSIEVITAKATQEAGLKALAEKVQAVKEKQIIVLEAKKAVLEQRISGLDATETEAKEVLETEIEALNKQIAENEKSIETLKSTIENRAKERDTFTKESASLKKEIEMLAPHAEAYQKEIDTLKQDVDKRNATTKKHQDAIKELSTAIENEKPVIAQLSFAIYELKMAEAKLLADIDELAALLRSGTIALGAAKEIIAQIDALKADLKKNTDEQAIQVEAFKKLYDEQQKRASDIKAHEAQIKEVQAPIADMRDKIATLETQLDDIDAKKDSYQATIDANTTKIAQLDKADVDARADIEALEKANVEAKAEVAAREKRIGGLSDAEEIAKLNAQIAEIEKTIEKIEAGELGVDAVPVVVQLNTLTIKEKALKDAYDVLNTALENAKEAEKVAFENDSAVQTAEKNLQDKTDEITALDAELNPKKDTKAQKDTELETMQADLQTLTEDIRDLSEQIQVKEAAKSEKNIDKNEKDNSVKTNKAQVETHKARVAELKKILNAKGKSLLCANETAIIQAFEQDKLSAQKPYKASGADVGLLTTTKLMFETVGLQSATVELATYAFAVIAILLIITMLTSTISKAKRAHDTCYDVTDNIIQCRMGNTLGKKFILSEDAVVRVNRSLKAGFFGYGTLTVTMGAGMAGEFTMRHIKSVKKMKRMLELQIAQFGRAAVEVRTPSYPNFPQFAGPQMPFPFPMPMPMINMQPQPQQQEEEECHCPYNQPRTTCPYDDE